MPEGRVLYKAGVPEVKGSPLMQRGQSILAELYAQEWGQPLIVTSTTDGKHMPGSRHYDTPHNAEDYRLPEKLRRFLLVAREALRQESPRFQLILEKDHFHLEVDKGG